MPANDLAGVPERRRNPQFDLLRLCFAFFVLLAHAPEITDGNQSRELMARWSGHIFTFGTLGIDGFFLLSGYLIVQSWRSDPRLGTFLQKRLLRIVPGYVVAVALSIVVVGLAAPAVPHFFHLPGWRALGSVLLLGAPMTAPVLPGQAYPLVNGSLWSIPYELRCYLLVAVLGVLGWLRKVYLWPVLTVGLVALSLSATLRAPFEYTHYKMLFGDPQQNFLLMSLFGIGGCYRMFREHIAFRPAWALGALAGLVAARFFAHAWLQLAFDVLGSYLIFFLAIYRFRLAQRLHRMPDLSYGIYLYGWPVEALWIFYVHGSPWVTVVASTAICAVLGWLSWQFVERPALLLKRQATTELPAVSPLRALQRLVQPRQAGRVRRGF